MTGRLLKYNETHDSPLANGAVVDADEYVSRLRSLNWKAMSVRVTEEEDTEEAEEEEEEEEHHAASQRRLGKTSPPPPQTTTTIIMTAPRGGGGVKEGPLTAEERRDAVDGLRRLPRTFTELPENGLGVLGDELRGAGLEHLMAAVLKQRAFKWTGGVD